MSTLDENTHIDSENCLPRGTRLAEFEITGIIGEGGFGIVYLAFDHSLQRTVALKEYMPGSLAGRGDDKSVSVRSSRHEKTFNAGLKSFINEARLLAQFEHPALIKVYRFWEENKTGYMAMRYYEGQTLKRLLKHHPEFFTEASLRSILKPILEALDVLYRVNILHRDISPDNIMIQKNGEAVLLDFGSARQIITGMSQAFTVILKPGYAPVEQYADDASMTQGPWTDIYSLSSVVYAAIVKKAPPTSVARMIKDPVEPLRGGVYPAYSDQFLAAIEKGMSIKPEDRPQTIADFRKWLGINSSHSHHGSILPSVAPHKTERRASAVSPGKGKPKSKSEARQKEAKATSTAKGVLSRMHVRPIAIAGGVLAIALAGYFVFHASHPRVDNVAVAKVASAPVEQLLDGEILAWEMLKGNDKASPEELENFLHEYPNGKHAEAVRAKLADIKVAADVAASKLVSAAAVVPDPVVKPTGVVTFTIKPWGNVVVDGAAKGVSPPLKKLVLPAGKHQIKITNPNFPDHLVSLDVSKKAPGNIEFDFSPLKK